MDNKSFEEWSCLNREQEAYSLGKGDIRRWYHRLTMVNTPLCKALGVKNQIFHSKEIQSPVA